MSFGAKQCTNCTAATSLTLGLGWMHASGLVTVPVGERIHEVGLARVVGPAPGLALLTGLKVIRGGSTASDVGSTSLDVSNIKDGELEEPIKTEGVCNMGFNFNLGSRVRVRVQDRIQVPIWD